MLSHWFGYFIIPFCFFLTFLAPVKTPFSKVSSDPLSDYTMFPARTLTNSLLVLFLMDFQWGRRGHSK